MKHTATWQRYHAVMFCEDMVRRSLALGRMLNSFITVSRQVVQTQTKCSET